MQSPTNTPRRSQLLRAALTAAVGAGVPLTGSAQSIFTDLELSLVTDISGSVDSSEYDLQMNGYASAFRNPSLHNAITAGNRSQIAVNLVFFDSSASVGLDWTILTGASDANAFANLIDNLGRPSSGGTNPASGIDLATSEIFGNDISSTRQVIDVSGDGSGSSTSDSAARDASLAAGVDAINGLVILGESGLFDYYNDNIKGGSRGFVVSADGFDDFEDAVLNKLRREILDDIPTPTVDYAYTAPLVHSTLRASSVTVARSITRDVGARLFRMRSGVTSDPVAASAPVPYSAKSAKGGKAAIPAPMITSEPCRWEVYGQVYYTSESQDAQYATPTFVAGGNGVFLRQLLQPGTDVDIWSGIVGFEYDFNPELSAGFAVSGADTDLVMNNVGTAGIDTLALIPYISYRSKVGGLSYYADLLYAYGMNDYDTNRLPTGAVADFEGDFHNIEFNTGMNFYTSSVVHGPYGQLRWLNGEIDAYTEKGPGAAAFPKSDYDSLATQLGYQLSIPFAVGGGTLVPQFRAAWEHEFRTDQGDLTGIAMGELDEDLAVAGVGVGYYMNCGWNLVLDYEGRFGSAYDNHNVFLKAGIEF